MTIYKILGSPIAYNYDFWEFSFENLKNTKLPTKMYALNLIECTQFMW